MFEQRLWLFSLCQNSLAAYLTCGFLQTSDAHSKCAPALQADHLGGVSNCSKQRPDRRNDDKQVLINSIAYIHLEL